MATCSGCGSKTSIEDYCMDCFVADTEMASGSRSLLTVSEDSQWLRLLASRLRMCGVRYEFSSAAGDDPVDALESGAEVSVFVPKEMALEAHRVLRRELLPS